MDCRLIKEIGVRVWLRTYWKGESECPEHHYHDASKYLGDYLEVDNFEVGGKAEDYDINEFPYTCKYCGAKAPEEATRMLLRKRLYNTSSGKPEPGDMYYAPWFHKEEWKKAYCPWDNCTDPKGHLLVVLPNGNEWDTDSRASNCSRKDNRTHRCWVKNGEPPFVHIDKAGDTCAAGAGSILSGNYHGFLHHGKLINC